MNVDLIKYEYERQRLLSAQNGYFIKGSIEFRSIWTICLNVYKLLRLRDFINSISWINILVLSSKLIELQGLEMVYILL